MANAPAGVPLPLHEEITTILRTYDEAASENSPVLKMCQRLLTIFEKVGWTSRQQLPTDQVAVDLSNRNGMGVHVENVYDLGADIKDVGWDPSETARAKNKPRKSILRPSQRSVRSSVKARVFTAQGQT